MNKSRKYRYDIILIVVLVCLSATLIAVVFLAKKEGNTVRVEIDGKAVAEYSLSKDGEYPLNNGSNILKISNGEAYLIEANCPDKTCVHTGKIRYVGQSIICLPNKLTVSVLGESPDGVDAVS